MLLCFCTGALIRAQVKKIELIDYLHILQARDGLYFNFIDDEVRGIAIAPLTDTANVASLIAYLQSSTGLLFSLVSDRHVVIHRRYDKNIQIRGEVRDADSGMPIPNASVQAANGQRTAADDQGRFSIRTPFGGEIAVSHIGFKKKRYNVGQQHEGIDKVFLEKDIMILDSVSVPYFMTKGLRIMANGSYEMRPRETGLLPGLSEPDVLQTLQQLPGVVSVDQSISNISVRSGTHDQNLFLWNGIRLFQTGHFYGLISAFNPNLPHKVTIYKNGTPASYGESVSGTIRIDSDPDRDDMQTSAGINLLNADFNTSFKTGDKTMWQFSGRRSLTDLFNSPVYKTYHERVFQNTKVTNFFADQALDYTSEEKFNFYDLTTQVRHAIDERSSLRVNAILIANNLEVTQQSSLDAQAETSHLQQRSTAANLIYEHLWSSAQKSDVQLSLSAYQLNAQDFYVGDDREAQQKNTVSDRNLLVNHSISLDRGWKVDASYVLGQIGVKNDGSSRSVGSQSLAFQLEGTYRKFFIAAGMRNIYYMSYDKLRAEPRLALSYLISGLWKATLSAELKSQTAYQEIEREQDFFGIETRRWKLADDQGAPLLTSGQVSFEIQYQRNGWLLMAETFAKRVQGINSGSQGFQNQFANASTVGDYSVEGLEILLQKRLGKFTGWVNFHLQDSRYNFNDLDPSEFTNSYEIPHGLRWGLIYGGPRLEGAIGGVWNAGRHFTQPNTRIPSIADNGSLYIDYASPNGNQLEDNFQLNASCSVLLLKNKRLKTGLAMQNILNTSSVINRSYRINQSNETIEEIDNYSLTRATNMFVRFYF